MKNSYSVLASLLLVAAVIVNAVSLFFPFKADNIVLSLFVVLGIAVIGLDAFVKKDIPKSAKPEKQYGLNVLSALAAVGFFIDFIRQSYSIIEFFTSSRHYSLLIPISMSLSALFAILSCFYYIIISFSYSGGSYDFRLLRAFHFAPLIWIFFKAVIILTDIVNFSNDFDSIIKLVTIAFGVFAVFSFIAELENDERAKGASVFFFKSFGFMSVLYFTSCTASLMLGKCKIFDEAFLSGAVFLLLGVFIYFYQKSIAFQARSN